MSHHADAAQPRQVLRLAVAAESLVVPIEAVHEILEVGRMTPMPQSPSFLRGVMNLRGAVVPVLDLAARFGLEPVQIGRRSAVVVVECAGDELQDKVVAGLLVDAVYEVLEFRSEQLESVPSLGVRLPAGFVAGMINLPSGYAALLSLDQILAPSDLAQRIAEAQES
ncbi:purine-binding chemotaxis protein CheW [Inhella inkyongensis]|uniref:Purine-binding chemotaxis protein CheW n=1 Tax=Inhella inkyongensis TaxID=392593 RepID=A0A840SBE5_9BURK|nr:chemotaxis protein CheW [Inhella inkyongensis]MBB5205670.1 purine-binding chemotaxis protein CheW [Inhella inkyongensis]